MENKYSHYIMGNIRQVLGLEPTDTSRDEEIINMSRKEIIEKYLLWEGIINFTEEILSVIEEVYDVYLEEEEE